MTIAAAGICVLLLTAAAAFHIYWGLGGKFGFGVALPQREDGQFVVPFSSVGALTFGIAMACVAAGVMAQVGLVHLPLPRALVRGGILLWVVLFLARALSWYRYAGFFKQVHDTRFAFYDTWLLSPGSLLLGLSLFYVCLS